MIKELGKECFEEVLKDCPNLEYLKDPDIPFCFLFVFNTFLEIFNCSHEVMTWTDILSYAIIRDVKFTQTEVDYIYKCNNWANEQIKIMRDEADDENRRKQEDAEGQTSAD